MSNEVLLPVLIGAFLVVVIFIRVMASKDHLFGRICRAYWNTSCAVSAFIPFLGWISRIPFLGPVKNHDLQMFVNGVTDTVSGVVISALEESVRIEREQKAREDAIKKELSRRGGDNISVNSDGSSATYTDKHGNQCNVNVVW